MNETHTYFGASVRHRARISGEIRKRRRHVQGKRKQHEILSSASSLTTCRNAVGFDIGKQVRVRCQWKVMTNRRPNDFVFAESRS